MINTEKIKNSRNKLIGTKEMIEILGLSRMSLSRLCKRRELFPVTKWNGKIYFSGEDLYQFVIKRRLLIDEDMN